MGKQGKLRKRLERRQRQENLLKMFEGDFYQEKEFEGQWYVKQWNGNTNRWQVAVYSRESFRRYKQYLAKDTFETAIAKDE